MKNPYIHLLAPYGEDSYTLPRYNVVYSGWRPIKNHFFSLKYNLLNRHNM